MSDNSPMVRKTAVWALNKPDNNTERERYWQLLKHEEDCGVRGYLLYGLLQEADKNELELWLPWAADINWSVRWCISEYLKIFKDCPELKKTFDPDLFDDMAKPVFDFFSK